MKRALRGINLGGWLIAERWMTPELFVGVSGVGERALGRELGAREAHARLEHHRSTFITEEDFAWCAQAGFDFVRIPVGYWLFEESEGFVEGARYLGRAFQWAAAHKLQIIVDFHGLQGSQNGYDHSGQAGRRLYRSRHVQRAVLTAQHLAKTYGDQPALLGLQLINEPKQGLFIRKLLRYYDQAIAVTSPLLAPNVKIIVSDAFQPTRMARALKRRGYGEHVVMDVHLYQTELAWWQRPRSYNGYVVRAATKWSRLLNRLNGQVPVMVGEWSAALPTRVLAGDPRDQHVAYFESQQQLFDGATWAHSYWTYKAPHNGPWGYRSYDFNG